MKSTIREFIPTGTLLIVSVFLILQNFFNLKQMKREATQRDKEREQRKIIEHEKTMSRLNKLKR